MQGLPAAVCDKAVGPPDGLAWKEMLGILDHELGRLSDRYRAPLVLCYLEGRTQEQAARQLGWSLNTLRRRLAQGRRLREAVSLVADMRQIYHALKKSIRVQVPREGCHGTVSPYATQVRRRRGRSVGFGRCVLQRPVHSSWPFRALSSRLILLRQTFLFNRGRALCGQFVACFFLARRQERCICRLRQ